MRRLLLIGFAVLCLAPALANAQPRIAPVAESAWTDTQRALAAEYGNGPVLRTLLRHPDLVRGVMPFAIYISTGSTLSPRHRELLILRTALLCGSRYIWDRHAKRAAAAGVTDAEIARVAAGPDAPGWDAFEAALLRAADELHAMSFVSDPTWRRLAARYDTRQLMDAVFTVAEFTMLAMTYNSVRLDDGVAGLAAVPAGQRPTAAPRHHQPLAAPRIPPLDPEQWTPAVRAMLDPRGAGRPVAAVYRTFAQHLALYAPRQILSEYIRTKATLSPRVREMLILRIGYLCGSDYEWAAHAPAGRRAGLTDAEIRRLAAPGYDGWSDADAAIVRAVDELFATDRISDDTWSRLDEQFDERQLLDLLITTGGYRMVSMALNTFGVPLEPDAERIPR